MFSQSAACMYNLGLQHKYEKWGTDVLNFLLQSLEKSVMNK